MTSEAGFFRGLNCDNSAGQPNEGIMGMAYDSIGVTTNTGSYFDALVAQDGNVPNLFTLQLCDLTGQMWLGGFDPFYFGCPMQSLDIIDDSYYVVNNMSDILLGGTSLGFTIHDFGQTIVDSGTTNLVLPYAVFSALNESLCNNAFYTDNFGCGFLTGGSCFSSSFTAAEINTALPTMTIVVGSITLTVNAIPGYMRVWHYLGGNLLYCPAVTGAFDIPYIIGNTIMNNYVTIFDRAGSQVHFAPQMYCNTVAPSHTASLSSSPQSACPSSTGLSGGAIAGIVIGVVAAVAIAGGTFFYCRRKRTTTL